MLFIFVCKSKNIISRVTVSHSECIAWIEVVMTEKSAQTSHV